MWSFFLVNNYRYFVLNKYMYIGYTVEATVEVMMDLFLWHSTKIVPHYFKLFQNISERKVYTVPGSSSLVTTPCSSSVSFLRIPSATSLSLMVVEGSEVKNRSTMCVPSAEKEQLNPQVSLRNDNKILHVQLIHWQMLQKFFPKTCHTILSLLSNKYKEKPKTCIIHLGTYVRYLLLWQSALDLWQSLQTSL